MVAYEETEGVTDGSEVLVAVSGEVGAPALEETLKLGKLVGPVNISLVNELGPLDEALVIVFAEKLVEMLLFREIVSPVDGLELRILDAFDGVDVPAELVPLSDEGGRLTVPVRVVVVVVKELKVVA